MSELASKNNPYQRKDVSKKEALDYFEKKGDEYKVETIHELNDGEISFYQQGNFIDLCRGPHIPSTGLIKAIKLTNIAGAYWKGDEKNKQLTRIYGITFPKQKELRRLYCYCRKKQKKEIIASWEKNWRFSHSMMMSVRDCRYGCRMAELLLSKLKSWQRKRKKMQAIRA